MVRQTATIGLAALLLAACGAPKPHLDPATVLVNHYPACAGLISASSSSAGGVTCRTADVVLTAWLTSSSDADAQGELQSRLLGPSARVDAVDRQDGDAVVIVRVG